MSSTQRDGLARKGRMANVSCLCRPGHYGRALEDAIAGNRNQWPAAWEDKSPLSGNATFNSMIPTERVCLHLVSFDGYFANSDTRSAHPTANPDTLGHGL